MASILICEDDPVVRSTIAALIVDAGHEVAGEVDDGREAIALLERLKPDIVIVDLSLRYGAGHQIVTEAASRGCQPIIFSSYVRPETLRAAPGAPFAVEKPDFEGLLAAVARAVTN